MFTQDAEMKASVIELLDKDLLYVSSELSLSLIMGSLRESDLLFVNNYIYKVLANADINYNKIFGIGILVDLLSNIKTPTQIDTLLNELSKVLHCAPEDFRTLNGASILHMATAESTEALITSLVKRYPALLHTKNINGENAGCYCEGVNRFTILKLLVKNGLNLHELDNFGNSVLYNLSNKGCDTRDDEKGTNTTELLSPTEQ